MKHTFIANTKMKIVFSVRAFLTVSRSVSFRRMKKTDGAEK